MIRVLPRIRTAVIYVPEPGETGAVIAKELRDWAEVRGFTVTHAFHEADTASHIGRRAMLRALDAGSTTALVVRHVDDLALPGWADGWLVARRIRQEYRVQIQTASAQAA